MSNEYTLYGAPMSLYTGKARAYLNYKQIPYQEVFSSLKVYKNVIVPNTGVRFVPVLKTPSDEYLQDTAYIVDTLEKAHPGRSVIPATARQKLVSYLFETWGDEWLVIPAMHYRWNKDNFPFIYEEFGKVVLPNMPGFIRTYVGRKIGAKFKGFVPMLGITDKTIPAIEDWYENHVLKLLNEHFAEHEYLLGSKPCIGDFALMGPLYAHLFRDPAPGKIMKAIAPNVAKWVLRMNQKDVPEGAYLSNDEIPTSLIPLLERMFKEQWPVLQNTVEQLEKWGLANPQSTSIPRTIGEHSFTIGNTTDKRSIATFHQWKVQRVLKCYYQFNGAEKPSVDEFLKNMGGLECMQLHIKNWVIRKNNQLTFSNTDISSIGL
ncbi:glutathione S-transferase [uncultured Paraglaciecola sp.]|uniref:glutathione S-transferase family protein n=1 Tax=uncultured Paraglaciecola sp. TaxID=1765024 RepID=UPI0025932450|nr:glutathione S-transferase [uncultured Paraglaciecola sp.]